MQLYTLDPRELKGALGLWVFGTGSKVCKFAIWLACPEDEEAEEEEEFSRIVHARGGVIRKEV